MGGVTRRIPTQSVGPLDEAGVAVLSPERAAAAYEELTGNRVEPTDDARRFLAEEVGFRLFFRTVGSWRLKAIPSGRYLLRRMRPGKQARVAAVLRRGATADECFLLTGFFEAEARALISDLTRKHGYGLRVEGDRAWLLLPGEE